MSIDGFCVGTGKVGNRVGGGVGDRVGDGEVGNSVGIGAGALDITGVTVSEKPVPVTMLSEWKSNVNPVLLVIYWSGQELLHIVRGPTVVAPYDR